jgi:hypothetical protein
MFDTAHQFGLAKKQHYDTLLKSYGPYRFFVTLTFQRRITVKQGREKAGIFWCRTTKKLHGRKRVTPIHGCAVMERASLLKDVAGKDVGYKNPHFHFLIKDHPIFSTDDDIAVQQMKDASWKAAKNFKTWYGMSLVSEGDKGIDVKLVYSGDITHYLSEDAWQYGWKRDERLFFLDMKGLAPMPPSAVDAIFW